MFIEYTIGRVYAGEPEVIARPSLASTSRKYLLFVHGAGDSADRWMTIPTRWPLFRAMIAEGYTVVVPELGGPQTWGNDVQQSRITAAYNYIQTLPGAQSKILIVAQSMGGLGSFIWAANNKAKVDRIAAILPVINLGDIHGRTDYYPGLIDAAYGGTYRDDVEGLTRNPLRLAASGALSGVDMHLWYGTTDALCKAADAISFSRIVGCGRTPVDGGHAETTLIQLDLAGFRSYIR